MKHSEITLIEKLRDMPPHRLLQMWGEGYDLADDWREAIEAIYGERGQYLPPLPSRPIVVEVVRGSNKGDALLGFGLLALILPAAVLGKMLAKTWLAWVYAGGLLLYFVVKYIRRGWMSEEQRAAEVAAEQAQEQGLSELMRCAADGNIQRVRELLEFAAVASSEQSSTSLSVAGAEINGLSTVGATALIYAARNGHSDIVELLLRAGADPRISSNRGTSAASSARQFGHHALAERLDQLT